VDSKLANLARYPEVSGCRAFDFSGLPNFTWIRTRRPFGRLPEPSRSEDIPLRRRTRRPFDELSAAAESDDRPINESDRASGFVVPFVLSSDMSIGVPMRRDD